MKITHRAPADASATPSVSSATPVLDSKVPRLSCCCRISELLPLIRQQHDAARANRLAAEARPGVAA